MQSFHRLALAITLLWAITSTGFSLALESINEQAAAATQAAAQAAAPEKAPDATPVKDAPKLKAEDEIAMRKLREKIMGDKIQIDQIAAQAQQQIGQRQAEMQNLSKQLTEVTEKANANSGADLKIWMLNQDLLYVKIPPKPAEAKKPEAKPDPKKQ